MDVEVDDSGAAQSTFDDNNIGVSVAHNSSGDVRLFGVRDLTIDGLNVAAAHGRQRVADQHQLASAATTPRSARHRQHRDELELDDRPGLR